MRARTELVAVWNVLTTRNPMNHFRRKLGSRVLASRLPTNTPIRLAMVNGTTVPHSIDPPGKRVASATVEFTAITNSEDRAAATGCAERQPDQEPEGRSQRRAHP